MNDDRAPDDVAPATGLPPPSPDAPHITGQKKPRPKEKTLAERLKLSRDKARALTKAATKRVSIQVSVPLEVHELLVKLTEDRGAKFQDVVRRCIIDGASRYAKLTKIPTMFEEDTFGMMARHPHLEAAGREYGVDEGRARTELDRERDRKMLEQAEALGLRGGRAVG